MIARQLGHKELPNVIEPDMLMWTLWADKGSGGAGGGVVVLAIAASHASAISTSQIMGSIAVVIVA